MPGRSSDVAAIERLLHSQQESFNAKDADRFAEVWRTRSWSVDVRGVELEGRDSIRDAASTAFAGPRADQFAAYEPGTVQLLGDDVAIVHVYARATTADGSPLDVGHSMIALYVLARAGAGWQIVARQDTLVPAPTAQQRS